MADRDWVVHDPLRVRTIDKLQRIKCVFGKHRVKFRSFPFCVVCEKRVR